MIYLDMDGVLADFDSGLLQHGVVNETAFIHRPREEWTPEQVSLDAQVVDVMKQPGFFYGLPLFKDTKKLWEFCRQFETYVLTARPKDEESGERVADEKWMWITDNLGPMKPSRFICCLRSEKKNFIRSSEHRHQILVDDLEANCKDWESVGGIGVVHTSATTSIKELKKYV